MTTEQEIIDFVNNMKFEIGSCTEDTATGDVYKIPVIGYMVIQFDFSEEPCFRIEPILHPNFNFYNSNGIELCDSEKLINTLPAISGDCALIGSIPDYGVTLSDVRTRTYGTRTVILCHTVPGVPEYNWKEEMKGRWIRALVQNEKPKNE